MADSRSSVNKIPLYGNVEVMMEPYNYLLQVPGKGMRSAMIKGFNRWLKIPREAAIEISKIVQALHTSSLLIDDIEDNSKLRRGIPSTHMVYGVPWTINCGNFVYFQAMQMCKKLESSDALTYFLEEMINLHMGQGFDIYWRDCNICPTEEEYMKMVMDKTGGLFRLAIKLMSCYSEEKAETYTPLVNNLGLWFQIRDDYINLKSKAYMVNKSFCEDLTEGKFSFPIIHCIQNNPSDRRLLNILKQRTEDNDIKKYAVEYMEMCGSFTYTLKKLNELRDEILAQIKALGGNVELEEIVHQLNDYEFQKQMDDPSLVPEINALLTPVPSSSSSSSASPSASSVIASEGLNSISQLSLSGQRAKPVLRLSNTSIDPDIEEEDISQP
eukprot:TRINITY_DN456_c1_g1_i1.p1 TRINITY_DN456_c1_g1~~TRINITY_DN456_c1_g1_i1.p1  ORF type:complete len:395 (+),score=167.21 TRINITY_DN456_c1_g1_i1:35-1186(+)